MWQIGGKNIPLSSLEFTLQDKADSLVCDKYPSIEAAKVIIIDTLRSEHKSK